MGQPASSCIVDIVLGSGEVCRGTHARKDHDVSKHGKVAMNKVRLRLERRLGAKEKPKTAQQPEAKLRPSHPKATAMKRPGQRPRSNVVPPWHKAKMLPSQPKARAKKRPGRRLSGAGSEEVNSSGFVCYICGRGPLYPMSFFCSRQCCEACPYKQWLQFLRMPENVFLEIQPWDDFVEGGL